MTWDEALDAIDGMIARHDTAANDMPDSEETYNRGVAVGARTAKEILCGVDPLDGLGVWVLTWLGSLSARGLAVYSEVGSATAAVRDHFRAPGVSLVEIREGRHAGRPQLRAFHDRELVAVITAQEILK